MSGSTLPDADLDALYRRELRPALHRFARDGRARISAVLKRAAIAGLGAVPLAILLYARFASPVAIIPVVALLLYMGIAYARAHSGYRDRFKVEVVGRIVEHLGAGLGYYPDASVTRVEFESADLFRQDIDRFRGEDLIEGRIGETQLRCSEVHAEDRQTRGSGKNQRTQWVTVFRGLFVIVDFPKEFRGRTVVLPDTAQRVFGGIGQALQSMNFTRGQLIKLEDPEFERAFVVYGDDQVEARYLLSTSLMQRIMDLRQKLNHDVYLSFAHARLFMALPSNRNRLEPPPLLQLLSFGRAPATEEAVLRRIGEHVADLKLITGIVEDLNLNRRIWG
jgi:hypothetical protein